jgi:hypothetical protein
MKTLFVLENGTHYLENLKQAFKYNTAEKKDIFGSEHFSAIVVKSFLSEYFADIKNELSVCAFTEKKNGKYWVSRLSFAIRVIAIFGSNSSLFLMTSETEGGMHVLSGSWWRFELLAHAL